MRHLLKRLAVAGLLLGVGAMGAIGCAPTADRTEDTGVPEPLPPQSFKREWMADLKLEKNDQIDRLFTVEDLVVAYTKTNVAYVLNKGSGRIRFFDRVTDSPLKPHPPVVLKERIVFPTSSTLEIYRRDGQAKERSFKTHSSLRTDAVGWPGGSRLYFGVDTPGAGRMVACETLPGQYQPVREVWELMSTKGSAINSAPAVWAGVVYVGFEDGEVYAVNGDTRATIWATSTGTTFKTFGPVTADLRADEFGVYVPSSDTKLYCLEKGSGRVRWQYHAGVSLHHGADVTASTVYLPVDGVGMIAIDKAQGPNQNEAKPKWVVRDMVKLLSEDEKYAYFQRADNAIVAVERATGEQRFTNKRRDLVAFATNARDKEGLIYAATKDGRIMCVRPIHKMGDVGELASADWEPIAPKKAEAVASR